MAHPDRLQLLSFLLGVGLLASRATAQLTDLAADPLSDCTGAAGNACETDDEFGGALLVGDWNDDGFADLAVGVPGETVSGQAGAGAVHVYYGYPGGLSLTDDEGLSLATSGVPGTPNVVDHFGFSLATGDLDDDGHDDLVVSAPYYNASNVVSSGAVWVFWGATSGLLGSRSTYLDQGDLNVGLEGPDTGDEFGFSLAVLRRPGQDELAIGVPSEDVNVFGTDQGCIDLEFFAGRDPDTAQQVDQDDSGFPSSAETGDRFGYSLAAGNFDGDSYDDLAIGTPFEDVGDVSNGGAVFVMYGDLSGIDENGVQLWEQDSTGVQGTAEAGDRFGGALAAGDFNDDGFDDLAIGVAGDNVGSEAEAGAVQVLYGDSTGLVANDQLWTQDSSGIVGGAETDDHLGAALAVGDFDADGVDDLAIGVPDENVDLSRGGSSAGNGGAINVLYGIAAFGLNAAGNQLFDQESPSGMPDASEDDDFFGDALAAGDFDGNGAADLAVGVPGEGVLGGHTADGAVDVLYGEIELGSNHFFGQIDYVGSTNLISVPESAGTVTLTVELTGSTPIFASVHTQVTANTNATVGVDFTGGTGNLSWNQGELGERTFTVTIRQDTTDESNEQVWIELQNPSAGFFVDPGADTLILTIVDDDPTGQIFVDGFESHDTSKWSLAVP
ncbi:MAG: Calx-beta domain-containing protein [Thermoanaerobaculia bacterium]